MTRKRGKKKEKVSPLGTTIPARYRAHPMMLTRWMTDIDNYARKKKKRKTPRALRHPQN
ncbi:MAG: hypothetical protein ACXACG_07840 [Candidatus Thorarchaeota archaeon]|jgi:hypothetical protein